MSRTPPRRAARVKGDFLDELLGRVSGNAGEALPGPRPSTSPTIRIADELDGLPYLRR